LVELVERPPAMMLIDEFHIAVGHTCFVGLAKNKRDMPTIIA